MKNKQPCKACNATGYTLSPSKNKILCIVCLGNKYVVGCQHEFTTEAYSTNHIPGKLNLSSQYDGFVLRCKKCKVVFNQHSL